MSWISPLSVPKENEVIEISGSVSGCNTLFWFLYNHNYENIIVQNTLAFFISYYANSYSLLNFDLGIHETICDFYKVMNTHQPRLKQLLFIATCQFKEFF